MRTCSSLLTLERCSDAKGESSDETLTLETSSFYDCNNNYYHLQSVRFAYSGQNY